MKTLPAITAEIEKSFDLQWAKDDEPRLRNFALTFLRAALLKVAEETVEAVVLEKREMIDHKCPDVLCPHYPRTESRNDCIEEMNANFKTFINQ